MWSVNERETLKVTKFLASATRGRGRLEVERIWGNEDQEFYFAHVEFEISMQITR